MGDRLEEEDKEALAVLDSAPPKKIQSYSHQLSSNTGGHYNRHPQRQVRKHSLDDNQIGNVDRYYDSSDDDFYPYATSSGVDSSAEEYRPNISQRLDHSISIDGSGGGGGGGNGNGGSDDSARQSLPEFIANGGTGIFKAPSRAAVHPARPPCLELRPHPLRETQVGKFLRTIACTENQLWAGQESGVRVWNLTDAYKPGLGTGGRARRGDEDAAPFYESSNTSPTMCMIVDSGSKLVWSGHKDGRIRSWKMDQPLDDTPFKEGLSWQGHRGAILSMVITSHGNSPDPI